jgi:hypothetical protein
LVTSGADPLNPAWLGRGDGGEDCRHKRAQVPHAIGSGTNDDDTERERRDLLLELDTAVHCDQNIKVAPHAAQEFPVLDTGPTAACHCLDSVAAELRGEVYR